MKNAPVLGGPKRCKKRAKGRRLLLVGLVNLTLGETYALAAHINIHGQSISTTTANAPAVTATPGNSVDVVNSQVTTRGDSATALHSAGTLTGSGLTLRTTGRNAQAVEATSGATVSLSDVQITTEGSGSVAVWALDRGTSITLNNASISTSKTMAYGVHSGNGSRVELGNVTVETAGDLSVGMSVFQGGLLQAAASHVTTLGREAHGVMLLGDSPTDVATAEISDSRVSTRGDFSVGINVNIDAAAKVTNSQIATTGEDAHGVWLATANTHATLDGVRIHTSGDGAVGVSSQGGTGTLQNVTITTVGHQAHGLYSEGATAAIDATDFAITVDDAGAGVFALADGEVRLRTGTVTTGNGGIGLYSGLGAHIAATDVRVNASGDGAAALLMDRGATLALDTVHATATGADSVALGATANADDQMSQATVVGGSLTALEGSAIAVTGGNLDLTLRDTTVSGLQVLNVNENLINGTSIAHGDVRITALNSALTGDVRVAGASVGTTQLQLDGSTLTGAIEDLGQLDVLNASRWTMTDNSTLGGLNNSSVVAFQPGAAFKTLTVQGDLTGTGVFAMNTDLATQRGDLLQVLGAVHGSHTLAVADSGHEPHAANGELLLVDGNGGDGRFALAGRAYVDAGAFRYTLEQQGDDWLLRNTSRLPSDSISAGTNAALGNQAAAATLWSAEMNALVKRLGELRMGNDNGGVWTRGIGKTFNVNNGHSRDFHQHVQGLEIGADKAISLPASKLYVGGMVGAATSSQNYGDGGSGEIKNQLVGIYATWLDERGYYLDSVAKYNWMDNEVKTLANTGQRVKGAYDTTGYAADIEFGRQIALTHNWFVEPQAEVTYTRTHGARYTASNGLQVTTSNADSLQGRLGMLVGKTLTQGNGLAIQPYVKASYVHEFAGDTSVKVNGAKLINQIAGSRVEVGGGGVLQLSEKTKLSLDIEHAKGRQVEEPWAVNLGVRYLW